jgi:hypothetical protein
MENNSQCHFTDSEIESLRMTGWSTLKDEYREAKKTNGTVAFRGRYTLVKTFMGLGLLHKKCIIRKGITVGFTNNLVWQGDDILIAADWRMS